MSTTPIRRLGVAVFAIAATSAAMLLPGATSTVHASAFCDAVALNPSAIFVTGFHQGTAANEIFIGSSDPDDIRGGGGSDVLCGRGARDQLLGGPGNDRIEGEEGNDIMDGEADRDVLVGGVGNDKMRGGNGDDELNGNDGTDLLEGGRGNDQLNGNDHDDQLFGQAGDDAHDGGPGNDVCTDTSSVLDTFTPSCFFP
jgi:Ca2+-binding RTX toxin-like protein